MIKISIRGSYKSVSETDRNRLLHAHKTGNDFLAVAKVLGINGTTYNIVETGREYKLAKGGAIARKIDNEIVSKTVEFFEKKTTSYCETIEFTASSTSAGKINFH